MSFARKVAVSAFALLLFAGCSAKPRGVVTGDSAYEMRGSIVKIARDLPPGRRDEFERAVETIMLATTDRRLSMSDDRLSPQAMSILKNRSVTQVIESAKLIRAASASL
jgi:hypothetical protein